MGLLQSIGNGIGGLLGIHPSQAAAPSSPPPAAPGIQAWGANGVPVVQSVPDPTAAIAPPVASASVHPSVWGMIRNAGPAPAVPDASIVQLPSSPLTITQAQPGGLIRQGGFAPLSSMRFGFGGS